ncbi:MAG: glycosyltransferase [Clostridiales bacterium]|nr:glycosyltransferase [Clostridiales bacterium]
MRSPIVSVIIPVYNAHRHVASTVRSVLSQVPPESEVILINDGSRDNSLAICRELAKADPRIYVIDQPNAGPGAARNSGLDVAKGEFILFVDSDDVLLDGAVDRLLRAIEGHDLVIAAFVLMQNRNATVRSLFKRDATMEKAAFLDAYVRHPGSFYYSVLWNKLYRRALIEERQLRFRPDIEWGEDFVFNAGYYGGMERVAFLKDSVYQYNRSTKGQTWRTLFRVMPNIRVKMILHAALRALFIEEGLYKRYWWCVNRYIFNATLFN